jgi:SAM-dependent methyltransferase
MSDNSMPSGAGEHLWRFRKSLPLRIRLQEVARSLGDAEGLTCLDIGSTDGAFCHHLRRLGGKWDTVVANEATAAVVRQVAPDNVYVFEGQSLPFKKKSFDAVVVADSLERIPNDEAFIEECHKLLKPDGKLIICVARLKPWSLIALLRRMFGQTFEKKGQVRPGYSETALFKVLKDGFDVHSVRMYSRFFVELTTVVVEALRGRIVARDGDERRLSLLYSISCVFYWLADQLDLLLFFNRGNYMIAMAKRRAWRPRKSPVLVDGRSISEAVLSKALN